MNEEWHYSRRGVQGGPISAPALRQLASSGQLSPTDIVWKQGMPNWVPADKIKGLVFVPPENSTELVETDRAPRPSDRAPKKKNMGLILGLIGGTAGLLVVIIVTVLIVVRNDFPIELRQGQAHHQAVNFQAHTPVEITVISADPKGDVDLYVLHADGRILASDTAFGPNCFIRFTPAENGQYQLKVINRGPGPNRSRLTWR